MEKQCNQLVDYFNRALTDEENALFEAHLIECPACQEELTEWEVLTEDLPYLSEEITPPVDLKARVFAAISAPEEQLGNVESLPQRPATIKPKKRFNFAVPALAAALFASLVTNAYLVSTETKEPEVALSDIEFVAQTTLASVTEGEQGSAIAMLLSDKGESVLLVNASNLPKLAEGELYQVWVIEGDKPYPAGVVTPTEEGSGSVSHPLKDLVGNWDTVAITIEKEPNLPAPAGSVVLAGSI